MRDGLVESLIGNQAPSPIGEKIITEPLTFSKPAKKANGWRGKLKSWLGPSKKDLKEERDKFWQIVESQSVKIVSYSNHIIELETQLAFKDRVIEKINGDLEFIRKDYHETGRRNWELFKETQILEAKIKKLERR